eukprot:tig00000093_g3529.t1
MRGRRGVGARRPAAALLRLLGGAAQVGRIVDARDPAHDGGRGFGLFCRAGSGGIAPDTVLLEYAGEVVEDRGAPPDLEAAGPAARAAWLASLLSQRRASQLAARACLRARRLRRGGRAGRGGPEPRAANVSIVEACIDGWPRAFLVAAPPPRRADLPRPPRAGRRPIADGEQLLLDYGGGYWQSRQGWERELADLRAALGRGDVQGSGAEAPEEAEAPAGG